MMKLPKVIIDTDIGDDIDDSFALLLAILSEKMEVLGVTTVYRNTNKRAQIARGLIKSLNKDIHVYQGEGMPLNNEINYAAFDKFDSNGEVIIPQYFKDLVSDDFSKEISAINFIEETINQYPNEVTILALGPLTNLGKLFDQNPDTFHKIKSIMFMGGQTQSNFKEWNIRCDVDAADKVFSSNVPMKVVGLDVTAQSALSMEQIDTILNLNDSKGSIQLKRMLKAYLDYFDGKRIPIMHDPLTVGCFIDGYCDFRKTSIKVIVEGKNRGRTIIDKNSNESHIELAYSADVEAFVNYLMDTIVNGLNKD